MSEAVKLVSPSSSHPPSITTRYDDGYNEARYNNGDNESHLGVSIRAVRRRATERETKLFGGMSPRDPSITTCYDGCPNETRYDNGSNDPQMGVSVGALRGSDPFGVGGVRSARGAGWSSPQVGVPAGTLRVSILGFSSGNTGRSPYVRACFVESLAATAFANTRNGSSGLGNGERDTRLLGGVS